jgi:HEAT repeats
MKTLAKTRKYVLLVVLAGIFIWVFCIIFQPFEPREPQYEGKKLTNWAKEVCPLEPFSPKDWRSPAVRAQNERAVAAIQHIGAKASLPWALKLCRAKDSWFKKQLEDLTEQHNNSAWPNEPRFKIHITSASEKQNEGGNIIWALGPKAAPAIPALIQLLQNQDETFVPIATYALRGIGTNAIPPVMALLNSTNRIIRLRVMLALELFGPEAQMAVPALVQCLGSPDPGTRFRAVGALGSIKTDAPLVVPAIVRCIESDTNKWSRLPCIQALGRFGTNAKPAASVLVSILKSDPRFPSPESPDGYSQASVLGALERIDPEAAKPFLEKWKASRTNTAPANARQPVRTLNSPVKLLKNPLSAETNSASP